jgi:hypothetical protein
MSENSLSNYGVNVDAINASIREDISKVLYGGDKGTFKIECIHNFDHFVNIIREIVGDEDPIEIEDFNGWENDFYYEFSFNKNHFAFWGTIYYNRYTLERSVG